MMKSYKEMSESVLKSINEHNIKKNMRNEILKRAIPLCCLCIALIGGGIFWNIGGYRSSAPTNTEGENRVTTPEDNALLYTSAAESYKTEPNNSSNQKEYVWICSRYENGALYYRYTGFDNMEDYSAANAEAHRKVLYSMSEKEREQWESRLDIENMFFYVDIATFATISEFYQALLERDSNEGEVAFDLYKNEEDCRNDKKLSLMTDWSFAEGMILKAYIVNSPQTAQTYGPSSPDDVPDILKGNGINEKTTVGELKDRLYFIDREDIKVYEIVLIDINSDPVYTRRYEMTNDDSDFYKAYGIYMEYTYLGETYAIDFYADKSGAVWFFQMCDFALKSEFPLRA